MISTKKGHTFETLDFALFRTLKKSFEVEHNARDFISIRYMGKKRQTMMLESSGEKKT